MTQQIHVSMLALQRNDIKYTFLLTLIFNKLLVGVKLD